MSDSARAVVAAVIFAALVIAGAIVYASNNREPEPAEPGLLPPLPGAPALPTYEPPPPRDEFSCERLGGVWVEDEDYSWQGACAGV